MILSERNYTEKINAIRKEDWQPLFDLIDVCESISKFEVVVEEESEEDDVIYLSRDSEIAVVSQFRNMVYDLEIIIDFNWGGWDEGRKIARTENFDFDTIDIPTKCKLITAIVRNDRFCTGALAGQFDTGLIQQIVKSIRRQVVNFE